jgi:hypothetical protein
VKTEEVWQGDQNSLPLPEHIITNEGAFMLDGVTPFEVTDEQMRAAGWRKMRRQVSEWEEIDD